MMKKFLLLLAFCWMGLTHNSAAMQPQVLSQDELDYRLQDKLDDQLFDAAEAGDVATVQLLLCDAERQSLAECWLACPIELCKIIGQYCPYADPDVVVPIWHKSAYSKGTLDFDDEEATRSQPLHKAVRIKDYRCCKTIVPSLLAAGADPNACDSNKNTPLHYAVMMRRLDIADLLIAYGAKATIKNEIGRTALALATGLRFDPKNIRYRWADESIQTVFELMCQAEADLTTIDRDGNTLLHLAAYGKNDILLKLLLDRKVIDVNTLNTSGETALHDAALVCPSKYLHMPKFRQSLRRVTEFLLDAEINPLIADQNGNTALHWAAVFGNHVFVRVLVDRKIDISSHNDDGKTALDLAREQGHEKIVGILQQAGAHRGR